MATLLNVYLKKEVIDLIQDTLEKKGQKGIAITIAISDEMDKYGQNVGAYVSQTEEERTAKKQKFYVGNGSVFWNKGEPLVITKQMKDAGSQVKEAKSVNTNDLPF